MVSPGKPETDWLDIRRRFEAGEPANAIAKTVPVSKQAILKKAGKQGWVVDPSTAKLRERAEKWQPLAATHSATGRQLATQDNRSSTQIANWGKRTPENAAKILAAIEAGAPKELAARLAGMDKTTLYRWAESDPDFAAQIEAATAMMQADQIGVITDAGLRGDWRASAHFLGKHPESRDTWGDNAGTGASGITLNINIARAETPANEADIVDVTPERTGT